MPVNWLDVSSLSFNALLLLERVQLLWLPGVGCEAELAVALRANPAVEWYLHHKAPELAPWLDSLAQLYPAAAEGAQEVRRAETAVLSKIDDWLVYALDPGIYDRQPFLGWDSRELTGLAAFRGKVAIDVGAGTGRLAFVAAREGALVFAVEPVERLRRYMKEKARQESLENLYVVDGLITDIPFPSGFAQVTMGGHVLGDDPQAECREMERVTAPGGLVVHCPGNNDRDNELHALMVVWGYEWSRFDEPGDGTKRKYWKYV